MTRREVSRVSVAASTVTAAAGTDAELAAVFEASAGSPDAMRECVLSLRRSMRAAQDAQLSRVLSTKGHDARLACSRELCVGLADVSVGELLQTISLGRKDAIIDVFDGSLVGRVWCHRGEIVDAVSGRQRGEAAAYRVLACDHGEMVADFRAVRRARRIEVSTQVLMLEAARRKDECAVLEARLGGPRAAYVPAAKGVLAAARGADAALCRSFAGGAGIDAVRAGSALDDLELLQAICSLVERGLLVACDGEFERHGLAHPGLPGAPVWAESRGALRREPGAQGVRSERDARGERGAAGGTPLRLPLSEGLRRFASPCVQGALLASAVAALSIAGLLRSRTEPELPVFTTRAPDPADDVDAPPHSGSLRTSERLVPPEAPTPSEASRSHTHTPPAAQPLTPLGPVSHIFPLAPAPSNEAPPAESSYRVHVVVAPSQAALWLDGERISSGELSRRLARDGKTHELRAVAPGYHPETILFRDAPPPRTIRLELASEHAAPPVHEEARPGARALAPQAAPPPRRSPP